VARRTKGHDMYTLLGERIARSAHRLEKLEQLGAPQVFIENERALLSRWLALMWDSLDQPGDWRAALIAAAGEHRA